MTLYTALEALIKVMAPFTPLCDRGNISKYRPFGK